MITNKLIGEDNMLTVSLNGLTYKVHLGDQIAYVIKSRHSAYRNDVIEYRSRITSAPKLRRLFKLAQAQVAAELAQ